MRQKLLILDVSALVYRAYFALPELTTAGGEPAGALYGFLSILLKTVQDRKPTHIVAAVDLPGRTFRHDVYKEYKATRPEMPDDLGSQFPMVYEALKALRVPVLGAESFEADDVIATVVRCTRTEASDAQIEIESGDQDVLQLVDEHTKVLAPGRGVMDIRVMDVEAVEIKLGVPPARVTEYKALRGDASDNIPGVRGIGPKTATELLAYADSLETLLAQAEHPAANAPKELTRFAEKLLASKDTLRRDQELVTLRDDAPVTFVFADAAVERFPEPAFAALLKRWGFETLLRRFSTKPATAKEAVGGAGRYSPVQGSLELGKEETLDDFIAVQEQQVREDIEARVKTGEFSDVVAAIERDLIPVISAMERAGILVDREALAELQKQLSEKQSAIENRIYKSVGKFNLASPKQLGEVLYDSLKLQARKRTAGGQRSTAAEVLETLRGEHPVVDAVLEWREVTKLLTTYVESLPPLIAQDGRIHAKFWQLGTTTGRIASSDPNLQNIPTRTEDGRAVRSVFMAPEGKVLMSADYSQIELRVAAILAEEDAMLAAFVAGEDIHSATAQRVFGVAADAVTAEMRRQAKVLNFGILYGMGAKSVSSAMGVSFTEGKAFLGNYFNAFPKLRSWTERVVENAREHGYTETALGRKRFLPELLAGNPAVRAAAERAAINAPVQGTATGDLVKRGMIALHQANAPLMLLVQVHDELLCEVAETDQAHVAKILRDTLETVWPESGVRLPVKGLAGKRWSVMEPIG